MTLFTKHLLTISLWPYGRGWSSTWHPLAPGKITDLMDLISSWEGFWISRWLLGWFLLTFFLLRKIYYCLLVEEKFLTLGALGGYLQNHGKFLQKTKTKVKVVDYMIFHLRSSNILERINDDKWLRLAVQRSTLQGTITYATFGKGYNHRLKSTFGKGYVSSQEGTPKRCVWILLSLRNLQLLDLWTWHRWQRRAWDKPLRNPTTVFWV